ncbi:hypothetical protein ACHAXT_006255 [Thalassiosira profunda]
MASRRLGDLEDEYGEFGEDEGLIELSGRRSRGLGRPSAGDAADGASGGSSSSSTARWAVVLFLLALAGVYHMGLKEGKSEVRKEGGGGMEDVEAKGGGDGLANDETPAPVQAPAKGGPFTLEKLKATRAEATKVVETIEQYYFSKEQATKMLMASWLGPWDYDAPEGETAQRERNDKLIDTMARALVTEDQDTFLMGGIGSSVMAGHDNCHYDSYQTQMERFWGPVWQAAGMEFVFQNAGEGGGCGDSYKNQHFCVKQNISPDVDIVHYSWTYFEGGKAAPEHEDLLRWAQMLPKQPPVHIFNTGTLPENAPDNELAEYYAKYGFNGFYMKTGFINGGHDYDSEKKGENSFDRFSWGYVGDGYHNVTRYGETEEDAARKASLGVVMRNWHPGPMGFQLTSDAFTYVYTQALLKALDKIDEDMSAGNDLQKTWAASERPLLLKGDLPEPKFCDPEYCVVDEAPGCLNYELPTFGYWGAKVEDPNDELNPHKGEEQNWNVWEDKDDMWHMVGKQDQAVFKDRDDKEICRHLDKCGGISAESGDNGMVVFRLPKMEVGLVVLCGCCGKSAGEDLIMKNDQIEIYYNTVLLDRAEWDLWPDGKCVRVLKRFPTSGRMAETPTGHAYLAVKALPGLKKTTRISHVITL